MTISIELNDDASEEIHYNHPDYPIYVRRGLLSYYPNHTAVNHWHDAIEFIAVTEGQMMYNVNGKVMPLHAGEGILVNSRQMHFGFSNEKTECDFICLLLHPVLLCSSHSFERDFVLPFIRNDSIPFIFLSPDVSWQEEILGRIRAIYENRERSTAPLNILSAFADIWALLYEHMPQNSSRGTPQDRDLTIIKNMTGFIQKNYAGKITLSDIAASGAIGQSKCCKLFLNYFSQSPMIYLNHYRLSKSIELLRDTDMTIIEIALSVGFGSASYYAETFRRWLGKSPTQFRKESRSLG